MGKATGLIKELSGKIGPLMFQQTKSGKVAVYVAPEVPETPLRTKKQMELRLAWGNLGAVYSQFHRTLKKSHEGLEAGRSDYNAFISDNTGMTCVYLKKFELANGGCVLAPYKISNGKLQSIYCDTNESNVLVTDIELGDLVIDEGTTVAEFSTAVLTMNEDYEDGDQLTFFYGQQLIDPVTNVPRAKIKGFKVKLDVNDVTHLWSIVTPLGFSTVASINGGQVNHYLGMDRVITDGAAAWVHSREDEQGNLKVSAQWLTVDSSVLQSYMGDAAFEASVQSYGGITNRKVFLHPDEETNSVGGSHANDNLNDNQGGTNGNSGTNGNENENQNTGGNTGGGSGTNTNPTNTVAAPTFAGETQFTESTQVTMSAEAGATIHYITDGTTPTTASTVYSGPLTLTETTTVKAVAVKNGVASSVTSRTYTKMSGGGGGGDNGDTE